MESHDPDQLSAPELDEFPKKERSQESSDDNLPEDESQYHVNGITQSHVSSMDRGEIAQILGSLTNQSDARKAVEPGFDEVPIRKSNKVPDDIGSTLPISEILSDNMQIEAPDCCYYDIGDLDPFIPDIVCDLPKQNLHQVDINADFLIEENQKIYTTVIDLYTSLKDLYCQLRTDNSNVSTKLEACSVLLSVEPYRIFPLPMEPPFGLLLRYSRIICDDLGLLNEAFLGIYGKIITKPTGAIYEIDRGEHDRKTSQLDPLYPEEVIPELINDFMQIDATVIMLLVKCSHFVQNLKLKQVSPTHNEPPEKLLCRYVENVRVNVFTLAAQFEPLSHFLKNHEKPQIKFQTPQPQKSQPQPVTNSSGNVTGNHVTSVASTLTTIKPPGHNSSDFHSATVTPLDNTKDGCVVS